MAEALTHYLLSRKDIGAVLGLGGSGNTAIVTEAMRALPVGVPKIMVSTLASGNVAGFVGPTDIMMMHAVTDIAGLNAISRTVIGNAAHAAAGMVRTRVPKSRKSKRAIGYTMFGVTTTCIERDPASAWSRPARASSSTPPAPAARASRSWPNPASSTACSTSPPPKWPTTWWAASSPARRTASAPSSAIPIPYVGSVGACDMVNFGPRDTVPAQFAARKFHVHNPHVTLMRTTPEENARIGAFIVERLNRMTGPVRFLLPLKGVSAIDAAGQPFHDPAADAALFEAIRNGWKRAKNRKLVELDLHINDPAFAAAAVAAFNDMS